ncbi:MAG: DUF1552 domain-containing protein [Chthoniobacteraceae bacterium]
MNPPATMSTATLSSNRRSFLRGLGACLALPTLESLVPRTATAAAAGVPGVATTASGMPLRTAFVYFPNGAIHEHFWPQDRGKDFTFKRTLAPLEKVRHRVQVLSGLEHRNAEPGPDGAGDHARANGAFLTGVRVKKTAGSDIHAGVSIDQVIAQHAGPKTRFPSLELSADSVRKSGSCDSGYSCAYEYNLAWRSPTSPLAPEPNPRLVFERLFGSGAPGERAASLTRRQQQQRSILDFVIDDARSLQSNLTHRDKAKLDEYLTSVREIEARITRAEQFGTAPDPAIHTPAGIPTDYAEHLQLMFEMLALAFETDSTRVATFLMAHDGSNRPFPELEVAEGHHSLSHHRNDAAMIEKCALIDRFYAAQFASFLEKLETAKDADGTSVLHNSTIVYGCGNSDGNRHTHHNLPIVLAGNGGGALQPGEYRTLEPAPMCNLFLTMLDQLGVPPRDRFGDSTGRLTI